MWKDAASYRGVSPDLRAKSLAALGCAPKRAFCEADVPEGARSDPSGLGAEMRPPEKMRGNFAPCGERPGTLSLDSAIL